MFRTTEAHQRRHEAGLTMVFSAEAVNNPYEAIYIRDVGGQTYRSSDSSYRDVRPQAF